MPLHFSASFNFIASVCYHHPLMIDLQTLFYDDNPPLTDDPITLFAAEVDDPYQYLFESDVWAETIGAGRQLLTLAEKLRVALPTGELLHADAGRILTLMADPSSDLLSRVARVPPELTGVVTLSAITYPLTVRGVFRGLYRAPLTVIGIPGVNNYQTRINRYYGLDSPSSVPSADAIAARRHFGEVVALSRILIGRARESRLIVPFYECLPFAERCRSCRVRPSERLIEDIPICGICRRKRTAVSGSAATAPPALIMLRVPARDRILEDQPTPAAYRRTATLLSEAIGRALTAGGSSSQILWLSGADALLAVPAGESMAVAARILGHFATSLRGHFQGAAVLHAGIVAGVGTPRRSFAAVQGALTDAIRAGSEIGLRTGDARGTDLPSETTLYAVDDLARLGQTARQFAAAHFPADVFADLSGQIARGTASLYFAYGRARLDGEARRLIDSLEREWGRETLRFYRALSDIVSLGVALNSDGGGGKRGDHRA